MKTEGLSKALEEARYTCIQLADMGVEKDMLEPFWQLIKECEAIIQHEADIKKKMMRGIKEAQKNGIRIGRPAIPCSDEFLKLAVLQSQHVITAVEAATQLNIGRSTFYKLKKLYHKEIKWKKQEV